MAVLHAPRFSAPPSMTKAPPHSGEMSQTDGDRAARRRARQAVDPYARKTKGYFDTLSLSSVGIEMGLSVIIGLLFGHWLDGKLGTAPGMMIVFLLFGCAAGGRAVWRAVKKADRLAAEASDDEPAAKGPEA